MPLSKLENVDNFKILEYIYQIKLAKQRLKEM